MTAVNRTVDQLHELIQCVEEIMKGALGLQRYSKIREFAILHPVIFSAAIITALVSSLPALCFLMFAICTLITAIIIFICIEGSVLIIGGIILIGVMTFIAAIVSGMMFAIAIAYTVMKNLRKAFCPRRSSTPDSTVPDGIVDDKTK